LPKKYWLRFTAENLSLAEGDSIHWIVENSGDEAADRDDIGHTIRGRSRQQWRRADYRSSDPLGRGRRRSRWETHARRSPVAAFEAWAHDAGCHDVAAPRAAPQAARR
jgi:hypothetical protein